MGRKFEMKVNEPVICTSGWVRILRRVGFNAMIGMRREGDNSRVVRR